MEAFLSDKSFNPSDENIAEILGGSVDLWHSIREELNSHYTYIK